jgi:hypothetical protein
LIVESHTNDLDRHSRRVACHRKRSDPEFEPFVGADLHLLS